MTIHNQLLSSVANLDPRALILRYGPPLFTKRKDRVGVLNERFWAAFYASLNEVKYENRENQYYFYGGKIFDSHSEHLILDQLANDIMNAGQSWKGYGGLVELCNTRHVAGCLKYLKGMVQQQGVFDQRKPYIHVNNGVIDLSSQAPKLVGFDPKFVSRNLIPIDYVPGTKCPTFTEELLKPLPEVDRSLLQKLFGMFLGGINFLQKIMVLEGAAESGKSQLAIVARGLIGAHNCAELRVRHLDDRFEIGRLVGKQLLIGADVAGDFLAHEAAHKLKGLTGGDIQGGERKNSNVQFQFLGQFCVLITCNSRLVTRIDGDRGAWLRRLILFFYEERKHAKNIPNFGQWLIQEEGSGILNWAIEGLLALNDEVAKYGDIVLTPEQKKRTEGFLDESEGIRHFVSTCIKAEANKDLSTDEIIEAYALYCADPCRGWIINSAVVMRKLPNVMLQLFHTAPSKHIARNNKQVRGYRNVSFI